SQKRQRFPCRIHRVVAMPAQLDVNAAAIVDLSENSKNGTEVDLPFTEHQVVVDAPAHVLDMNVPKNIFPTPQVIFNRQLALAMKVADIDRQTEVRMGNARMQVGEAVHGVDKHARFRLERQPHTLCGGEIAETPTAVDEPGHED